MDDVSVEASDEGNGSVSVMGDTGSLPQRALGVPSQNLRASSGENPEYARILQAISALIPAVPRQDAPQADEISFPFLMPTETDIREHFRLVHSTPTDIRDEIIHKRTENHSVEMDQPSPL